MTRWIVGVFLVICLAIAGYFIFKPPDDCDYASHARKVGVDFGATVEHVTAVKGNLGLSDADIRALDQFREDYAEKYRNICLDWKRKIIANDEYNCRRENMDKTLDQFRLLNTVSSSKDKGQVDEALNAIKQFASSGAASNCRPAARLIVNPNELNLSDDATSVWTQVANLGSKDARYSFDQLPQSFLPTPASGSISSGQTISIVFVRTKYPLLDKEINFLLRDDSSEQISLRIRVSRLDAQVYTTWGSKLANLHNGTPTIEEAVNFVRKTWPGSKSEAADYLVAANLLDSAQSQNAASTAASLSVQKDKSLETNPTAQFTLAFLKMKSGDNTGAQVALKQWAQTASSTGANTATVRYFTGAADLKMGNWSSAKENLCSDETKGWAEDHTAWIGFGADELGISGLDRAVNSDSCKTRVLGIALARTNRKDPEYGQIFSAINRETYSHEPKTEKF